jgi:hypothetical protein
VTFGGLESKQGEWSKLWGEGTGGAGGRTGKELPANWDGEEGGTRAAQKTKAPSNGADDDCSSQPVTIAAWQPHQSSAAGYARQARAHGKASVPSQ